MLIDRQENKRLSKIISVYSTFFDVTANESYQQYIKTNSKSKHSTFKLGTMQDH